MRFARLGLLVLLLCPRPAAAQVSATLSGVVSDPSGAVVAAAAVVAKDIETGAVRQTATDPLGQFRFLGLPVGGYEVTASKDGFQSVVRTGIHLVVGQTAQVDFRLTVGRVQEHSTVNADVSL